MEDKVFDLHLTKEEIIILQELTADESRYLEIPPWKGDIYDGLRGKAFNAYRKPVMSQQELDCVYRNEIESYKTLGCSRDILTGFVDESIDRVKFYFDVGSKVLNGMEVQEGGADETEE